MNTSAWRHPLGTGTRPAGAYHSSLPVRPDAFRCGGRKSKFLLMQCHPEDRFTRLSINKPESAFSSMTHISTPTDVRPSSDRLRCGRESKFLAAMRAAVVGMMLLCGIAQGAEPKSVTNSIGMELIEIPAGKFTMGSPVGEKERVSNEEQVAVTLSKPFGLGKTEVTQGQWMHVMGTEPWKGGDYGKADTDCPATYVSWHDATEFCKKLTDLERKAGKLNANEEYRLPTEAEWEYACRAGTTTVFSFGDDAKQLGEYGWFGGNTARELYAHKVGLKKPNSWGLHDMHGNVWEWCSDWYGNTLLGGTDPVAPREGIVPKPHPNYRVLRGGCWRVFPVGCRSANRYHIDRSFRNFDLGFRVARSQLATAAELKK